MPPETQATSPDDRPLRIAQLGPTRYRGGVASAISQLCIGLARAGQDVLLLGDGGDTIAQVREAGVAYGEVSWNYKPKRLLRNALVLRRRLRAFRPDIVHVHGRGPSLLCHLGGRKPDWFTLHNTHLTEQVGRWDAGVIRRHLSPLARNVFALDEKAVEYMQTQLGVPHERIALVANGVDCIRFHLPDPETRHAARQQWGVEPRHTMVLFVGRLHEQKHPELIIDLAAAARERGLSDARFVMVGSEGPLTHAIRERIEQRGVGDICRLHDWADPVSAYQAADLLVLPSRYEGYGLVAAEALACGCPVLRSRTGGFTEMIIEGETGFGCEADGSDFIDKALRLLAEPRILQPMRPAARRRAQTHLSLNAQVAQVLAAYRAAL